jgi:hypothetical protein
MNLTLLVVLSVTGSGKLVTNERAVGPFHALAVSSGIRATFHRGSPARVVVRADDNVIASIETKVKDGRLEVGPTGLSSCSRCTMEVDVTLPALDGVEASGGSDVRGDGLSGSKCTLELSGGTHVQLGDSTCERLELTASGGAVVKLSGQAKQLKLEASGGVELDIRALQVKQAQVDASGGVTGKLAVSDTLDGSLSGGVQLKVKGHPKTQLDRSGGVQATFED